MNFERHITPAAEIRPGATEGTWHLELPTGPAGSYRLAQLDNYTPLARGAFPQRPPLTLRLRARVSDAKLPGTWGFGLWNDPFSLALGLGGGVRRFPALPNAAWFFGASPQNYLSFRDDLPAHGFIAQTFRAASLPAPLLGLGALGFPLLLWPRLARAVRAWFRRLIAEQSFALAPVTTSNVVKTSEVIDPAQWHAYTLTWRSDEVSFGVDDQILISGISPRPPLGLVIWVDNQYAAFTPAGKITYGTLENHEPAWLEIEDLQIR